MHLICLNNAPHFISFLVHSPESIFFLLFSFFSSSHFFYFSLCVSAVGFEPYPRWNQTYYSDRNEFPWETNIFPSRGDLYPFLHYESNFIMTEVILLISDPFFTLHFLQRSVSFRICPTPEQDLLFISLLYVAPEFYVRFSQWANIADEYCFFHLYTDNDCDIHSSFSFLTFLF